jgi:hypothetical protein
MKRFICGKNSDFINAVLKISVLWSQYFRHTLDICVQCEKAGLHHEAVLFVRVFALRFNTALPSLSEF